MNLNTPPDLEKDLLARLTADNPGRKIFPVPGCDWGRFIVPAPDEHREKSGREMRILVIGSWTLGLLAFEAVKEAMAAAPEKIDIVGLVTDDPLLPEAKISRDKRFWRYYDPSRWERYLLDLIEDALGAGVPCHTGQVKSDAFRARLAEWAPEAIVVSAFGQRLDAPIIDFPKYGIYNVHPSDLMDGYGAGPQPWEDLIERKAETTRATIHLVTETIDSGSVVGRSPLINVRDADGETPDDVRLVGEKTLVPVKRMVGELVHALCRKRDAGEPGPVRSLDFEACFTEADREHLMSPISREKRGHILPLSGRYAEDTV